MRLPRIRENLLSGCDPSSFDFNVAATFGARLRTDTDNMIMNGEAGKESIEMSQ